MLKCSVEYRFDYEDLIHLCTDHNTQLVSMVSLFIHYIHSVIPIQIFQRQGVINQLLKTIDETELWYEETEYLSYSDDCISKFVLKMLLFGQHFCGLSCFMMQKLITIPTKPFDVPNFHKNQRNIKFFHLRDCHLHFLSHYIMIFLNDF